MTDSRLSLSPGSETPRRPAIDWSRMVTGLEAESASNTTDTIGEEPRYYITAGGSSRSETVEYRNTVGETKPIPSESLISDLLQVFEDIEAYDGLMEFDGKMNDLLYYTKAMVRIALADQTGEQPTIDNMSRLKTFMDESVNFQSIFEHLKLRLEDTEDERFNDIAHRLTQYADQLYLKAKEILDKYREEPSHLDNNDPNNSDYLPYTYSTTVEDDEFGGEDEFDGEPDTHVETPRDRLQNMLNGGNPRDASLRNGRSRLLRAPSALDNNTILEEGESAFGDSGFSDDEGYVSDERNNRNTGRQVIEKRSFDKIIKKWKDESSRLFRDTADFVNSGKSLYQRYKPASSDKQTEVDEHNRETKLRNQSLAWYTRKVIEDLGKGISNRPEYQEMQRCLHQAEVERTHRDNLRKSLQEMKDLSAHIELHKKEFTNRKKQITDQQEFLESLKTTSRFEPKRLWQAGTVKSYAKEFETFNQLNKYFLEFIKNNSKYISNAVKNLAYKKNPIRRIDTTESTDSNSHPALTTHDDRVPIENPTVSDRRPSFASGMSYSPEYAPLARQSSITDFGDYPTYPASSSPFAPTLPLDTDFGDYPTQSTSTSPFAPTLPLDTDLGAIPTHPTSTSPFAPTLPLDTDLGAIPTHPTSSSSFAHHQPLGTNFGAIPTQSTSTSPFAHHQPLDPSQASQPRVRFADTPVVHNLAPTTPFANPPSRSFLEKAFVPFFISSDRSLDQSQQKRLAQRINGILDEFAKANRAPSEVREPIPMVQLNKILAPDDPEIENTTRKSLNRSPSYGRNFYTVIVKALYDHEFKIYQAVNKKIGEVKLKESKLRLEIDSLAKEITSLESQDPILRQKHSKAQEERENILRSIRELTQQRTAYEERKERAEQESNEALKRPFDDKLLEIRDQEIELQAKQHSNLAYMQDLETQAQRLNQDITSKKEALLDKNKFLGESRLTDGRERDLVLDCRKAYKDEDPIYRDLRKFASKTFLNEKGKYIDLYTAQQNYGQKIEKRALEAEKQALEAEKQALAAKAYGTDQEMMKNYQEYATHCKETAILERKMSQNIQNLLSLHKEKIDIFSFVGKYLHELHGEPKAGFNHVQFVDYLHSLYENLVPGVLALYEEGPIKRVISDNNSLKDKLITSAKKEFIAMSKINKHIQNINEFSKCERTLEDFLTQKEDIEANLEDLDKLEKEMKGDLEKANNSILEKKQDNIQAIINKNSSLSSEVDSTITKLDTLRLSSNKALKAIEKEISIRDERIKQFDEKAIEHLDHLKLNLDAEKNKASKEEMEAHLIIDPRVGKWTVGKVWMGIEKLYDFEPTKINDQGEAEESEIVLRTDKIKIRFRHFSRDISTKEAVIDSKRLARFHANGEKYDLIIEIPGVSPSQGNRRSHGVLTMVRREDGNKLPGFTQAMNASEPLPTTTSPAIESEPLVKVKNELLERAAAQVSSAAPVALVAPELVESVDTTQSVITGALHLPSAMVTKAVRDTLSGKGEIVDGKIKLYRTLTAEETISLSKALNHNIITYELNGCLVYSQVFKSDSIDTIDIDENLLNEKQVPTHLKTRIVEQTVPEERIINHKEALKKGAGYSDKDKKGMIKLNLNTRKLIFPNGVRINWDDIDKTEWTVDQKQKRTIGRFRGPRMTLEEFDLALLSSADVFNLQKEIDLKAKSASLERAGIECLQQAIKTHDSEIIKTTLESIERNEDFRVAQIAVLEKELDKPPKDQMEQEEMKNQEVGKWMESIIHEGGAMLEISERLDLKMKESVQKVHKDNPYAFKDRINYSVLKNLFHNKVHMTDLRNLFNKNKMVQELLKKINAGNKMKRELLDEFYDVEHINLNTELPFQLLENVHLNIVRTSQPTALDLLREYDKFAEKTDITVKEQDYMSHPEFLSDLRCRKKKVKPEK